MHGGGGGGGGVKGNDVGMIFTKMGVAFTYYMTPQLDVLDPPLHILDLNLVTITLI